MFGAVVKNMILTVCSGTCTFWNEQLGQSRGLAEYIRVQSLGRNIHLPVTHSFLHLILVSGRQVDQGSSSETLDPRQVNGKMLSDTRTGSGWMECEQQIDALC